MSVPGIKRQLDQGDLLDAARLDVFDAVDILEIELELVDDQPFHLGRAHAVEVLDDVDLRQVERGKNVHPHAINGQAAAADQGDHQHEHGDRMAEGKVDRVHARFLLDCESVHQITAAARSVVITLRVKIPSRSRLPGGTLQQPRSRPAGGTYCDTKNHSLSA